MAKRLPMLGWLGAWAAAGAGGCTCDEGSSASSPAASAVAEGLSAELAPKVLAKVGDRTITLGEYAAVLERMDQFERLRYQTADRRRKLLDEIIRVELLAAEARRRGLDQDPKTVERIRQVLRDELLKKVRRQVPQPAQIRESEVRAHYDQHRQEFHEPERRRVAHIVVASQARAEQLLQEAMQASPAQWGNLVREDSLDRSGQPASTGALELAGDLGIVSRPGEGRGDNPKVPEELRAAVFEIPKVGGVHGQVVKARGRFHIVRMTGKTEARERSFTDAQRSIRVSIVQERIRAAEKQLEEELRKRIPVRIDEQALAKVSVPSE